MSLEKSEAVILKTYNWSESSRTVVFFSQEFGRIALVDKGGRSIKSKRGRLVPFSRSELTFYHSEKETSGYISDVELLEAFSFEKEGTLGRLAYASAACELLHLLLPEDEPQRALYNYFVSFLRQMDTADRRFLPAVFVAFYLRLLSQLGYHPSLAYCASCGKELTVNGGEDEVKMFGVDRGGFVCAACQKAGDYYISFSGDSHKLLLALQTASLSEAATLPIGFSEAAKLLDALTKFVGNQTGLNSELKSLQFIEKLKNAQSIG